MYSSLSYGVHGLLRDAATLGHEGGEAIVDRLDGSLHVVILFLVEGTHQAVHIAVFVGGDALDAHMGDVLDGDKRDVCCFSEIPGQINIVNKQHLDYLDKKRQDQKAPAKPLAGMRHENTFLVHGFYDSFSVTKIGQFFKMTNKLGIITNKLFITTPLVATIISYQYLPISARIIIFAFGK